MLRHREAAAIGLIALTGALVGCDTDLFSNAIASDEGAFMAVGLSDVGGTEGLTATADAVTSKSATISLPEDILADAPAEAFLAVSTADIAVVINGVPAGRSNPAAKEQEHHAAITFRLAHENQEPCDSLDQVGPFEMTITEGVVTLAEDSFPLGAGARSVVRNGRFEMCAETLADFDGSISVGNVSFEFGRLRGGEEPVTLCHIPPGNPDDAHTITIGASAEAHLAHGDYLGECEEQDENPQDDDWGDDGDEGADGDDADDDDDGGSSNENNDDDVNGDDEDGASDDDDAGDETDDDGDDLADSDGDGVYDDADPCGGTPAGETVDQSGCSCSQRDGDGDGVDDCDDACPKTEPGADVDETGCADADLDDDDGDGVTNGTDDCPATASGEAVDETGCSCIQRDGDADGVDDCDDVCPSSESGAEVDETGCADSDLEDDDGDGVNNGSDTCPDTPAGEAVDATGCSCSQRDADSDGVDECDDACADTGTGLSVDANGCAADQLDDDNDGVMDDADACANTPAGETIDADGCGCSQLDTDSDGKTNCGDLCPDTPDSENVDGDGCSASQLTRTATVPGPTDIYLAGQPDGTTATWTLTGWTSEAPQHSPVMIDISTWAGKELRFTATGTIITGGNNGATPDGRNWVLRPNGLSQVFGLTAMTDYREGTLVGVFLTDDLPTSGLLPYMSSSGMTTTTPLLQHVFVIGSSSQVVVPTGATRLFFGVAEQQGLIIDNSGSFEVTVEAVAHTPLPTDPLASTRFYIADPNDPKDGIGWFDEGQWAFDYDFDGVADFTTTFGAVGDQPVVADWNGDGLDEIGVMTPSDSGNVWKLDMNGDGAFGAGDETITYGADADSVAIVGDWDGDGAFELGFTTPDTLWHFDLDGDRTDDAGEALDTEYESSIPVIGDWMGDGISNLANSTSGSYGWRFDLDNDRRWIWGTDYRDQHWAWGDASQDTGVAGDWDGDGLDDPAKVRAGTWSFTDRVQKGGSTATSVSGFGTGKTPVVGSWAAVRAADAN